MQGHPNTFKYRVTLHELVSVSELCNVNGFREGPLPVHFSLAGSGQCLNSSRRAFL